MQDILSVSFGAVLGGNIRFIIYKELQRLKLSKSLCIFIINTFSSFLLGLSLSIISRITFYGFSNKLVLFFSIGLLGSISTFSTFVYDLFDFFLRKKIISAVKLYFISIFSGVVALTFGFFLGNQ